MSLPAALLRAAPVAGASSLLDVATIVQRRAALTGRVVRGRLAHCRPLSCGLLDGERLEAPIAWLSFAATAASGRAARGLVGRMVADGMVLDRCWSTGRSPDVGVRTDRAAQLRPGRIVGVLPDGAPAR